MIMIIVIKKIFLIIKTIFFKILHNKGGKIIDKYSPEILTHIISDIEYEDIIKYLKVESIKVYYRIVKFIIIIIFFF